jgi:hypothetical protein
LCEPPEVFERDDPITQISCFFGTTSRIAGLSAWSVRHTIAG